MANVTTSALSIDDGIVTFPSSTTSQITIEGTYPADAVLELKQAGQADSWTIRMDTDGSDQFQIRYGSDYHFKISTNGYTYIDGVGGDGVLWLEGGTTVASMYFENSSSGTTWQIGKSSDMGGNDFFGFRQEGNVRAYFDADGDFTITAGKSIQASSGALNLKDRLFLNNNGSTSLWYAPGGIVIISDDNDNQTDCDIIFGSNSTTNASGMNEMMRITDPDGTYGGSVGIGTASPAARLHVETAAISSKPLLYVKNAFYNTTEPIVHFENTNSNNGLKPLVQIETAAASNDQPALVVLNGNVGLGTSSPSDFVHADADGATLNISGNMPLILGSDHNTAGRTNTTRKFAAVGLSHYTNAEEPTSWLFGDSDANSSHLSIGGGIAWMNAVEDIKFYTAGNTTTTGGTQAGHFDNGGNLNLSQALTLASTKGLYFDGGSDTYIKEYSANVIHFYTGGTNALQLSNNEITVYGNVIPTDDASRNLGSSSKRFLDVFSSKLKAADGNNSTPSHTFANDTTMGMYRPGTNTLGFATGGTSRLQISNDAIYNDEMPETYGGGTVTPWMAVSAGTGAVIHRTEFMAPYSGSGFYWAKIWFEVSQSTGSSKRLQLTYTRASGNNVTTIMHLIEANGEYPNNTMWQYRSRCATTTDGSIFTQTNYGGLGTSTAGAFTTTTSTNAEDIVWQSGANDLPNGGGMYGTIEVRVYRGGYYYPNGLSLSYA